MSKTKAFRKMAREHLKSESAEYPKNGLVEIPKEKWPTTKGKPPFRVLRGRKFFVQLYLEPNGVVRISVTKAELGMCRKFADGISWDELQEIKRWCGYGDLMAVEIYPADCNIVNDANMRYLWVLNEFIPVGWFASTAD